MSIGPQLHTYASYLDWRISPHADRRHREIQIVYNTGHHRPCGGQFFMPHSPRLSR